MKPHTLDSYKDRYDTISFKRSDDGILEMKFHGRGGEDDPLVYGGAVSFGHPNTEWSYAFVDVARDYDNEVVIFTAAGQDFITETGSDFVGDCANVGKEGPVNPLDYDFSQQNNKWTHWGAMSIECPVVSAVHGRSTIHAELALHADIVICSDDTIFQDMPHFYGGLYVAGDGSHVTWPALIGQQRSNYFLMTGEEMSAARAHELGVVAEVTTRPALMPRAYELAREILRRPKLVRRYTRVLNTQLMREQYVKHQAFGLALNGMAMAGRELVDPASSTATIFSDGAAELNNG